MEDQQQTLEQGTLKMMIPPSVGERITSQATGNTYRIEQQIGEGNFGVVFACTDSWENALAVKVLKPNGSSYEAVRWKAAEEFKKLLAVRCPFITFVLDAFEFRDTFYIVTERCAFNLHTLFSIHEFDGRVWIMPIARCILQAVHYMHLNGLVHQDIHLGNVFGACPKDEMTGSEVNSALHFKLADLGIAKVFEEVNETNTRAEWMRPPEVLNPKEFGPVDYRVDIYHLGLLFLHLMSGSEVAFSPQDILDGRPRSMALNLPPPLNFALEKTLRRHVQHRTQNVMELWRDLKGLPKLPEPNL